MPPVSLVGPRNSIDVDLAASGSVSVGAARLSSIPPIQTGAVAVSALFSGSAVFAPVGIAVGAVARSAALTGAGTFAPAAQRIASASAQLTASSALAPVSDSPIQSRSASFAATASLAPAGARAIVVERSASFGASSAFAPDGTDAASGAEERSATFTAQSAFAPASVRVQSADATIAASGALSPVAQPAQVQARSAAFTGTTTMAFTIPDGITDNGDGTYTINSLDDGPAITVTNNADGTFDLDLVGGGSGTFDVLIQPVGAAETDLSGAIYMTAVSFPATNQDAVSLGMAIDTAYNFRALQAPAEFSVARAGADTYAVSSVSPDAVAAFTDDYYRRAGADVAFGTLAAFGRAGDGAYIDASGALQTAASGAARIDHHRFDGATWVNKGILLNAEARTNYLADSTDFSAWTPSGSPSLGTGANILGTASTRVTATASADTKLTRGINATIGSPYCYSIAARHQAGSGWMLNFLSGLAGSSAAWFDVQNKAVGTTQASVTATYIDDMNGAGVFTSVATTTSANGSAILELAAANGSSVASSGSALDVLYAQYEAASARSPYPTMHIATAGATATREAESLTISGADLPATTSDFSVVGEWEVDRAAGQEMVLFDWQADASNRITLKVNTSNAVILEHVRSGTTVTITGGTISGGRNVPVKAGFWITAAAANLAVNGTAATEQAVAGTIDLTASAANLVGDLMGTCQLIRAWDSKLGDAAIAGATT